MAKNVIASPKGVPARRSAPSTHLASKSFGTQAWQSRFEISSLSLLAKTTKGNANYNMLLLISHKKTIDIFPSFDILCIEMYTWHSFSLNFKQRMGLPDG